MDSHPERRMYVTKTELTSRVLRVDIGSADGNYSGWAVSGVDINFDDSDLEGMVASIIHRVCPDSPVHAEIVATTSRKVAPAVPRCRLD